MTVKIIDKWTELDTNGPGPQVIALGNFDGVHIGHRQLITATVAKAKQLGAQATVLTFNPHPLQLLAPDKFPRLLSTLNQRLHYFAQLGVDQTILLPFTQEIADESPQKFVADVLVGKLHAAHIFVGFNYTFGQGGKAGPAELEELGRTYGFGVSVIGPIAVQGVTVSSTEVRQAMERGDIADAKAFLGYWPALEGIVVSGDRVGRTIGFPTANVEPLDEILIPARGVYAAWVAVDGKLWPSMVNIGLRPTFQTVERPTIEAHLFDFAEDIYDHKVEIIFCQRLRDECKFASIDELIAQLQQDKMQTLHVLQSETEKPGFAQNIAAQTGLL
ncbi:MAG: bifunctional riboflavin kinase/FAD synthetase [Peptococcaceae bacterium]|nr:bifunctional riboflavin kinase/FAD synthetase [Peptococcaceae bacterium]